MKTPANQRKFYFEKVALLIFVLMGLGLAFYVFSVADGSDDPSAHPEKESAMAGEPEQPAQDAPEAVPVEWESAEPDFFNPSTVQAFEKQLGCLEQVMDAPYQPVPVARNGLFRSAAQADLMALRARFAHFEGLLGLSHPRNYSDYSRLARIVGAAQRQGQDVIPCVLDREHEQGE